jgi:hypothetical protein
MTPSELRFVGAICQQYGKRVNGGWELSIPQRLIANMPMTGTIMQLPQTPGNMELKLLYSPNTVIDGGKLTILPDKSAPALIVKKEESGS